MARGTTGAPRNAPGHDTRNSQAPGFGDPGADGVTGKRPDQPRSGGSRLIAFVCGRRSKYVVVAFWVLVVAALGGLAGKLQGAEKNDASAYLPSSAESTQELNEQNLFQSKNLNPALVVYVRDGGVTAGDLQKAKADARYFASLGAVNGRVAPPVISKDHKAIQTVVGADLGFNSDIGGFVSNVKNTASKDSAGLKVYVGGPAASAADQIKIFKGIDTTLLYATLAVVIVLLLLTYRSPVLWLLPILSAGVALTVAQAVIYLLTQHANLTVNGQSEGILVVLVIGASTDYALLLIARYREELRRHADRHEAMAVALRRAGPAIIASGLTVVAGHALPARGRIQRHLRARSCRRGRHRRGPDRDDHTAAGGPRDLRPVDLLAGQAGFRFGRADQPRVLVAGRSGHQPPPAHSMAGDRDPAGGQRGRDDRVQVRHAHHGPGVPWYAAVHRRAERAGDVLPGRFRRAH